MKVKTQVVSIEWQLAICINVIIQIQNFYFKCKKRNFTLKEQKMCNLKIFEF